MSPAPKLAIGLGTGLVILSVGFGLSFWQHKTAEVAQKMETAEKELAEQTLRAVSPRNKGGSAVVIAGRVDKLPRPPVSGANSVTPIPESDVTKVLGDSGMSYDERRRELRDHIQRKPLPPEDREALETFVRSTQPPVGLNQKQTDALKSSALFALRTQDSYTAGATDLMRDISENPAQGLVMREFALQHLRIHHEDVPEQEQEEIEDILWEAAENGEEDEVVATGLLGLDNLNKKEELDEPESNHLAEVAIRRLNENPPQAKVVALQTLANIGDPSAIETAAALLQGETRHPSTAVRLAAIYYIGETNPSEASRSVLQQMKTIGDKYETAAAETALTR